MGKTYPEHIIRETLEHYAATGNMAEAAREHGVPKQTAQWWKVQALAATNEERPVLPIPEPLPAVLDRAQRRAMAIGIETLEGIDPTPERAQAAAKLANVAGNLYLDHTVGRRGTQPQSVTVIQGTDLVLALLAAQRELDALPEADGQTVIDLP